MQVGRFADGKIVERWGATDELGILRQLGAQVSAPETVHSIAQGDQPVMTERQDGFDVDGVPGTATAPAGSGRANDSEYEAGAHR